MSTHEKEKEIIRLANIINTHFEFFRIIKDIPPKQIKR